MSISGLWRNGDARAGKFNSYWQMVKGVKVTPGSNIGALIIGKARAVSDLVKTELPVAAGICVVAGEMLALGRLPTVAEALLGFLTGFFISGSAMISNDYFDLGVDRINRPERPLPSGREYRFSNW